MVACYTSYIKRKRPTLVRWSSGSVVGTVGAKIRLFIGTSNFFLFFANSESKNFLRGENVNVGDGCIRMNKLAFSVFLYSMYL